MFKQLALATRIIVKRNQGSGEQCEREIVNIEQNCIIPAIADSMLRSIWRLLDVCLHNKVKVRTHSYNSFVAKVKMMQCTRTCSKVYSKNFCISKNTKFQNKQSHRVNFTSTLTAS